MGQNNLCAALREQIDGFRLISWNIESGGGECAQDQIQALISLRAHIVALQEVRETTCQTFRTGFEACGYDVRTTFDAGNYRFRDTSPAHNGLLIASCWQIRNPRLIGLRLPRLHPEPTIWRDQPEECMPSSDFALAAIVDRRGIDIEVYNAHMPHGISTVDLRVKLRKVVAFHSVFEELRQPSPWPRILCGDLNSPWDERGGVVRMCYEDISSGNRWAIENHHVIEAERKVICGLRENGWFDAFRQLHDYRDGERDAFSKEFKEKGRRIGRRLDYIYASGSFRPKVCRYLHRVGDLQLRKGVRGKRNKGDKESGLSDHAPVEAILDLLPAGTEITPRRCPN